MSTYATIKLNFLQLVKACVANFIPVFKHTWYLVLLAGVFTYISAGIMQWNLYIGSVVAFLLLLAIIFIYAVVLLQGDTALKGQTPIFVHSFRTAKQRYIRVLGGNIVMLVIGLIMTIIAWGLLYLGKVLDLSLLFYVIAAGFSIFVTFVLYFAMPIIVIQGHSVARSFDKSVRLTTANWVNVFGVLLAIHFVIFLVFLVSVVLINPRDFFIALPWIAVLQFLIYPLIVSTLLTLIHDSELKIKP